MGSYSFRVIMISSRIVVFHGESLQTTVSWACRGMHNNERLNMPATYVFIHRVPRCATHATTTAHAIRPHSGSPTQETCTPRWLRATPAAYC